MSQLLMKFGVSTLPSLLDIPQLMEAILKIEPGLWWVGLGIIGYAISMLCWLKTLHYLPLSVAYPLLSLSYILVYLGAVSLPWFSETGSLIKLTGITIILGGVWLASGNRLSKS